MLVDRGLLTEGELEQVLAEQKETGRRLVEIIVDQGFISGPTLALTLAEQWGVELTSDEGFGTGLRTEIQRRHEGERRRRPVLRAVDEEELKGHEIFATEPADDGTLAEVSAQLAEDDVRIVQLEAHLLERDQRLAQLEEDAHEREDLRKQQTQDRAEHEARISELVARETNRIEQALVDETAKLEQRFSETQKELLTAAADWRAKHEAQIVKLLAGKLGRLEAAMQEARPVALDVNDRQGLEERIVEVVAEESAHVGQALSQMRKELLAAAAEQRSTAANPSAEAVAVHEDRIAKLVAREANRIEKSMLDETRKLERQFSQTSKELLAAAERQTSEPAEADRAQHEARLVELVAHASTRVEQALLEEAKKLDVKLSQTRKELLAAVAEERSADAKPSAEAVAMHEDSITKLIARETGRIEKILLKQTERLERRLSETHEQLRAAAEREAGQPAEEDRVQHEAQLAELVAHQTHRIETALREENVKLEAKQSKTQEQLAEKFSGLEAALNEASRGRGRDDETLDQLGSALRAAVRRLDQLEQRVHSATSDILARLDTQAQSESPPDEAEPEEPSAPVEHLVFAPGKTGYSVITVDLPPPPVGAELSLGDGHSFVVTKVAASPFPRDERPCAYLQRVT